MSWRDLKKALPPGPRVPGALQLMATWKRPAASLERLRQRYGKRITVQLPFQPPFVILSDPEDIKQLFTAPPDVLHPGEGARVLEPLIGRNSVILLDEAPHLEQRRLMLPAFHGEKMQRQIGLMTELTEREVDSWPLERPIALHPRLQRLTLEIILRAVFGLEQGTQLERLRDVLTGVLAFSESPLSVLPPVQRLMGRFGPTKRFEQQKARADPLIFELIDERRAERATRARRRARDAAGGPPRRRLADVAAGAARRADDRARRRSRDDRLAARVDVRAAGPGAAASSGGWSTRSTRRRRRVPDGDDQRGPAAQAGAAERRAAPDEEAGEIGGFEYPAGVALLASAYLVHHDPAIYPEPKAFRPERFLGKPPGTYTWIPFGGGRRRCLGRASRSRR